MDINFKISFVLLLFSISISTIYAQQTEPKSFDITGVIEDQNGDPISEATITASTLKHNYKTQSDSEGFYQLRNLEAGVLLLEIRKGNFIAHHQIAVNSKNFEHNISINTSGNELGEVHLQAESFKNKMEKKGFALNVVETAEASIRNIQTNELLNTTVGVKIRQNGGLGSRAEYSLNGLSGSAVRIFIDGIPISTFGSSYNLNSIPPSMIERIEVYKGVVPGHLADDALGGAINIVLNKQSSESINASLSYGSFNTFQANVNGLYRFDNSGFTVKASAFHNYSDNDYEVSGRSVVVTGLGGQQTPITARRFNDAYRSTGGTVQLGYTDVNWADQFFVGFTGSDDYKEVQHGAFMTIMPYEGRFLESDATLANLTYQKQDLLTTGLDVNVTGYYGKRNRQVNDTVPWAHSWSGERAIDFRGNNYKYTWGSQQEGGPTLAKINRNVASMRTGLAYAINNNHKILANHVYSGIDREDSDELQSVLENTFLGTRDLHKNILSLTYELNAFDDRLKTNLFGKYYQQKSKSVDPEIEINPDGSRQIVDDVVSSNKKYEGYGFAASYELSPTITLLASAEKAVRLPNETEIFGNDGDNVVANASINPEQSNNYNLGLKLGTFNFKKHQFNVSTNLFTRNIKDRIGLPIETSLNVDEELIVYVNQGSGTSKGIDAQLGYNYNNNFGLNFNVSRFDLKIENRGVEIDVPNTPFFTMNGNLRYSFKDLIQKNSRLNLFYTLYFTDEFSYLVPQGSNTVGDEFFKVPQQLAQDLGLSYTFPNQNFVMSFDVKNIFDKPVYDNLSVQKPGRAFYLKLNYSINKF
ncbi:TonB-dependent receptor [Salegentibacter salinarum]|uniref:TonB-dependent receptor n=1 Tax=Salegentibacter salinarum TaxID=447422 RepID=A0A2N0U134_9FLAO|nr:TonB-dependent receptor [Salegentibacter salinarum]PKD20713.1 TonB-dependent receptor [Salegentibacter salinarum]SKB81854.1 Outer membrane receptor proteins, mostly Fe transport [Salegentibacter salinarum]